MRKIVQMIGLVMLLMTVGCGKQQVQPKGTLTISAAASLTDCMEEIKGAFNEKYPDTILQFNFGASGTLAQQIEQGAPADIFFSAGSKQVKALDEKELIVSESTQNVLHNRLVLITSNENPTSFSFKTLETDAPKQIAVGEMGSVPVGQYTKEVFDSLGITDEVDAQLVYAKDVREVLFWVETGNAEVGIVYETDAKISDKVKICDLAKEEWHTPIIYPATIIKDTKNVEVAQLFMDFLKTEKASEIFRAYGFTPEGEKS